MKFLYTVEIIKDKTEVWLVVALLLFIVRDILVVL